MLHQVVAHKVRALQKSINVTANQVISYRGWLGLNRLFFLPNADFGQAFVSTLRYGQPYQLNKAGITQPRAYALGCVMDSNSSL